ncbi:uncharacterized protein BCR38DRAFT_501815 [Pseudomassariella vexata]|uniref:Uncharacterized protein n=1 Tax=Pseudomassariella vexata TaxID=1141098 RepID=A0A1Y2DDW1_9PEZI|nr:uncharacterized protein BCR38DRAFT_501815 [Pseudomassariella vexata]ORY57473.1 hypothetical protein BCR38DRAFT_501815 [Pseudomassariella vexata]
MLRCRRRETDDQNHVKVLGTSLVVSPASIRKLLYFECRLNFQLCSKKLGPRQVTIQQTTAAGIKNVATMGFRQILKDLVSNDRKQDEPSSQQQQHEDARAETHTPFPALEPENTPALSIPTIAIPTEGPKKITGKRKPSDAAWRPRASLQESRYGPHNPAPSEYLYFGEGGRSPGRRSGASAQRERAQTTAGRTERTSQYHPTSGRDDSGFLVTGVRTQQAGYSNLTYGGSLQYDYSGTQAPF